MPYTNDSKPSSTYTNDSKGAGTTYLLMEDGYRLLQEDGSPIVLTYGIQYAYDTVGAGSYSNDTKP